MLKYNELYAKVKEDSRLRDRGAFSHDYKEHWLEKSKQRQKQ
jgi:hypothetical protein